MPIAYPYKMSDWYGYDQDCSSVTLFYLTNNLPKLDMACYGNPNNVAYHNGSSSLPVLNDTIYSNAAGTTTYSPGVYGVATSSGGFIGKSIDLDTSSVVDLTSSCN